MNINELKPAEGSKKESEEDMVLVGVKQLVRDIMVKNKDLEHMFQQALKVVKCL